MIEWSKWSRAPEPALVHIEPGRGMSTRRRAKQVLAGLKSRRRGSVTSRRLSDLALWEGTFGYGPGRGQTEERLQLEVREAKCASCTPIVVRFWLLGVAFPTL